MTSGCRKIIPRCSAWGFPQSAAPILRSGRSAPKMSQTVEVIEASFFGPHFLCKAS